MRTIIVIIWAVALGCLTGCGHSSEKHRTESDSTVMDTAITNGTMYPEVDSVLKVDIQSSNPTQDIPPPPTTRELEKLQDFISHRWEHLDDNPLQENIWGCAVLPDAVMVSMAINTPYWQEEFKKHISDSPYITFDGPSKPKPISELVDSVAILPTIILHPDSPSFPVNSKSATFTLTNNSDRNLDFGVDYIVGYKGSDNLWYRLPQPGFWADMGITLLPTEKYEIKVSLHPGLNKNKPGMYRLYKRIRFDDEKIYFWVMTEFELE